MAGIFSQAWVKVFTQVSFIAVFLHAWVGIRDLWMDYIKPFGVRLFCRLPPLSGWSAASCIQLK